MGVITPCTYVHSDTQRDTQTKCLSRLSTGCKHIDIQRSTDAPERLITAYNYTILNIILSMHTHMYTCAHVNPMPIPIAPLRELQTDTLTAILNNVYTLVSHASPYLLCCHCSLALKYGESSTQWTWNQSLHAVQLVTYVICHLLLACNRCSLLEYTVHALP